MKLHVRDPFARALRMRLMRRRPRCRRRNGLDHHGLSRHRAGRRSCARRRLHRRHRAGRRVHVRRSRARESSCRLRQQPHSHHRAPLGPGRGHPRRSHDVFRRGLRTEDITHVDLVREKVAPETLIYQNLSTFSDDQVTSNLSGGVSSFENAFYAVTQDRTSLGYPMPVWPAALPDEMKGLLLGLIPSSGLFDDEARAPDVVLAAGRGRALRRRHGGAAGSAGQGGSIADPRFRSGSRGPIASCSPRLTTRSPVS